jgi:Major Facilitator Superfamily
MAPFVVVATVTTAAARAGTGVRAALICGFVEGEERLRVLGALRTVNHIGFALGAAVGGLVIGLSTPAAFTTLVLLDAGTFGAYAAIVAAMPAVRTRPRDDAGPALAVLRDGPYVTLATLMGVLALCWAMLSSGLPLWVVSHTEAPTWISGVIVLVSSVGIAALQVRATRVARKPLDAARTAVCAGAALAISCLLFAATDGLGGAPAIALLLAAGVAHVVGELLFVAASWGLSIPLMPEDAPGQYQGMFATGEAAATMAGPALMTTLVVGWGQPGWLALGAIFLLAMAPTVPVTHWALRTRPAAATAG